MEAPLLGLIPLSLGASQASKSRFRVSGLGFRVEGFGFRVEGFGFGFKVSVTWLKKCS